MREKRSGMRVASLILPMACVGSGAECRLPSTPMLDLFSDEVLDFAFRAPFLDEVGLQESGLGSGIVGLRGVGILRFLLFGRLFFRFV